MSLRSLFDSLFTVLGSRSSAPRPHRLRALTFFQPSTFNVQLRARALKGGPTRPGDGILLSERMNETAVVPHRPFQLSTFNFQLLARALALLAVCAPSLHAQQKPNENAQVLMNFKTTGYGIATGSRYRVTLGTGVWTVADVVDTWVSGQGTSAWSTSPQYAVPLTPGQFYQLLVDPGTNNSEVLFSPPPGYSVYQSVGNDLMPITSWHTTNVNNGQILPFTILPSGGILPAGQSTSPKAGNIVWSVGVGHQTNGTSAGLIQMRAQDISAASFSADSLFYAAPSGVTVTPDSAVLGGSPYTSSRRVIYAPEAMVLFRPISSTSYNIEFFDPSFHAVWGNDAYFHVYDSGNNLQDVSSNYYTVSQLSDGSLNIGYYCVMQQNTPARLARSWTVSHSSGLIWGITQDDLVRKVVGSSVANSSGDRVETTTTTSEDGTTIATKTVRTYHVFPWSQEEITSEVADPDGLALTTTYDYYTDSSATGYGKLKTLYRPDGSWERYWYRSDDASYGLLDAVLRPWQDSTITPDQATTGNCDFTRYAYAQETTSLNFFVDVPVGFTHQINGTVVGQEQITLNYWQAINSQPLRAETVNDYSASSVSQTTFRQLYNHTAAPDWRGRLYTQVNPEGTKVSTLIYRSGGTLVEYHFNGFSTQITGSVQVSSWNSQNFEAVYMVPNKSTIDLYSYGSDGRVHDTTQYLFTGTSGTTAQFELLTTEHRDYGPLGQDSYIRRSNNYVWNNQWYTGPYHPYSTDNPDGTSLVYTVDNLGRPLTTRKVGVSGTSGYAAQGDTYTHATFDAAGNLLSQKVSDSSDPNANPANSTYTTHQYSKAGLLTQDVNEASSSSPLTTTYAYSNGTRTVTATLPGGFIKISDKYLDGSPKSLTGTAVVSQYYTTTVNSDGTISKTIYIGTSSSSPRWTRVTTDWLGRKLKEEKPSPTGGTFTRTYNYNSQGQLYKVSETGLADTLTAYNAQQEPYRTGLDINANGTLDGAQNDRFTETVLSFEKDASTGFWWQVVTTNIWNQPNVDHPVPKSIVKKRLNGFASTQVQSETVAYDIFNNKTDATVTVDLTNRLVTTTTVLPDSSTNDIAVAYDGLKVKHQTSQNLTYTYGYDSVGRSTTSVDPRTGTSTTNYVANSNRVASSVNAAGNSTSFGYESSTGRLSSTTDPLGNTTYQSYNARGQVTNTWGVNTYPVQYVFNSYGEQTEMDTFRDTTVNWNVSTWPSPGAADATTWNYDAATGVLLTKTDAASKVVTYTYNARGQLATRAWARGVTTTYSYSAMTAEQTGISYSDSTPAITYTYTRLGQTNTVADYTGTHTFAYDPNNTAPTTETLDTFYSGRVFTRKYDTATGTVGRSLGYKLGTASSPSSDSDITYGYDGYDRFTTLNATLDGASAGAFTYGYTGSSNLNGSLSESGSGLTQSRTYETHRNLVTNFGTTVPSATVANYAYTLDALGRRTAKVETGAMYTRYGPGLATNYGYNPRSEVTSAKTYIGTATVNQPADDALLGRSFNYAYDPIGNRTTTTISGQVSNYTSNNLNQLVSRTVPGYLDVAGLAAANASVTINGAAPTRQLDYFYKQISASNTSNPVWTTLSISAAISGGPSGGENRNVYLAKSTESFTYDLDGNITSDGHWDFTWDAENRLVNMTISAPALAVSVPAQTIQYRYDYLGRRVEKKVYNNGSSSPSVDLKFAYSSTGWHLLAEYDALNSNALVRTYSWGLDMSRTLADAGGVGGLLAIYDVATSATYLPAYDGNGNILALVNKSSAAIAATYEYSPFGETLRAGGSAIASTNPFRFSTKYTDSETQLLYYGFRYCQPNVGRWLGRDPLEEKGGLNLYNFVRNAPVNIWDVLGRGYTTGDDPSQLSDAVLMTWTDGDWERYRYDIATAGQASAYNDQMPSMIQQSLQADVQNRQAAVGQLIAANQADAQPNSNVAVGTATTVASNANSADQTVSVASTNGVGGHADVQIGTAVVVASDVTLPNNTGTATPSEAPNQAGSTGGYWSNATPAQIAAAYGAAWDANHPSNNGAVDASTLPGVATMRGGAQLIDGVVNKLNDIGGQILVAVATDGMGNMGKGAGGPQASKWDTSITAAGSRVTNVATNVGAGEFQSNLVSNGFSVVRQTVGSNGPVTVLSNGQTTYTIYTATSTGAASAQVTNTTGQVLAKIRLGP